MIDLRVLSLSLFLLVQVQVSLADACDEKEKIHYATPSDASPQVAKTKRFEINFLERIAPETPALNAFKNRVLARTNVDPIYLIEQQMKMWTDRNLKPEKSQGIVDKKFGTIRELGGLEKILLNKHLAETDSCGVSEFSAIIMEKLLSPSIVYFTSTNKLNVNIEDSVFNDVRKDIRSGYTMTAHLHNHPFQFNNPSGDTAAVLVPSGNRTFGDVAFHNRLRREFGMKEAWITNGFNSIALSQDDVAQIFTIEADRSF